jgi:two-component system, OmpR family, response regulator
MTRILVVDDEVGVCSVIQHLLVRQGYLVTAITDGRAAIEVVARDDYDAALVDLNLAEIDGNDVMRAARAAKPDVPIVMMSGMVLESGRGAPDFLGMSVKVRGIYRLAKPFKPKDLLRLIEEILPHQDVPMPRTAAVAGR